eukprot:gene4415-3214_t
MSLANAEDAILLFRKPKTETNLFDLSDWQCLRRPNDGKCCARPIPAIPKQHE